MTCDICEKRPATQAVQVCDICHNDIILTHKEINEEDRMDEDNYGEEYTDDEDNG